MERGEAVLLEGRTKQEDLPLGREGEPQAPITLEGRAVEEKSGFSEHSVASFLKKPETLPFVRKRKFSIFT